MLETPGLPPYPPARNAWEFPPPPVAKPWKWIAIGATVLAVVVATALTVALVRLSGEDAPGLIEDGKLLSIIDDECALMTSTVESLPLDGSPSEQARTIADQNLAISHMLAAIERRAGDRRIRADRPTRQWLADWVTLVDARNRFLLALTRRGVAEFTEPVDPRGDPLHLRMEDVWVDGTVCKVPESLLAPRPDGASADI